MNLNFRNSLMLGAFGAVFLVFFTFSSLLAQQVKLTVLPQNPVVNQPVQVTVSSTVGGDVITSFPGGFVQGSGYQESSSYQMDAQGNMYMEISRTYVGIFSKPGKYTFGPFYIKNRNRSFPSNSVTVTVSKTQTNFEDDFSAAQLRKPVFGIIEKSAEVIYEGQALLLTPRVYTQVDIVGDMSILKKMDINGSHQQYPLKNYLNDWTSVTIRGRECLTNIFDKTLIFPSEIGVLNIEPFILQAPTFNGMYKVQSTVPKIEVLPLPAGAPKSFIAAVGDFECQQTVSKKSLKQGEVLQLKVILSGDGNLHNITEPKLKLPKGMLLYGDPVTKENFEFTDRGASGQVEFTYNIQMNAGGNQQLPFAEISFFSPTKKKYITLNQGQSFDVEVLDNPNFKEPDVQDAGNSATVVVANESATRKPKPWYMQPLTWSIGGGATLLLLLLLFLPKKRKVEEPEETPSTKLKPLEPEVFVAADFSALTNNSMDYSDEEFAKEFESQLVLLLKNKTNRQGIISRAELLDGVLDSEDQVLFKSIFSDLDAFRFASGMIPLNRDALLEKVQRLT